MAGAGERGGSNRREHRVRVPVQQLLPEQEGCGGPLLARSAFRILRRLMPREDVRSLTGDYVEIFRDLQSERGPLAARLWLWWQVLAGLPRFFQHHSYWSLQMFRNYLLSTLRNLRKDKIHSLINILGLAIGLACVILILLFVPSRGAVEIG